MRIIERVLVGEYNTLVDPKLRIVSITKKRLEDLLTDSEYPVYTEYPELEAYQRNIIDTNKVLGYLNNFRIVEEEITGIIKVYADFNITYRGNTYLEGDKRFYMSYVGLVYLLIEHIEGDHIEKIMGWVYK